MTYLRKVTDVRLISARRGGRMVLSLECGHANRRKQSKGIPTRATCLECQRLAKSPERDEIGPGDAKPAAHDSQKT